MSELYHHGILGMHWGIRRTPEELGHVPARTKTKKFLGAKHMSDEELRNAISRLRAEEDYRALVLRAKQKDPKGFISTLVSDSLKNLASRSADRFVNKTVDKMFADKFNYEKLLKSDLSKMSKDDLLKAKTIADTRTQVQTSLRKSSAAEKFDPNSTPGSDWGRYEYEAARDYYKARNEYESALNGKSVMKLKDSSGSLKKGNYAKSNKNFGTMVPGDQSVHKGSSQNGNINGLNIETPRFHPPENPVNSNMPSLISKFDRFGEPILYI